MSKESPLEPSLDGVRVGTAAVDLAGLDIDDRAPGATGLAPIEDDRRRLRDRVEIGHSTGARLAADVRAGCGDRLDSL